MVDKVKVPFIPAIINQCSFSPDLEREKIGVKRAITFHIDSRKGLDHKMEKEKKRILATFLAGPLLVIFVTDTALRP